MLDARTMLAREINRLKEENAVLRGKCESAGSVDITVSRADLKILCDEILESYVEYNHRDSMEEFYCTGCGRDDFYHRNQSGGIQHAKDCPYLVAKDLSTGL